jgi:hypothetical protein
MPFLTADMIMIPYEIGSMVTAVPEAATISML